MNNNQQPSFVNCPPCEGVPVEQLGGTVVPPSDFQSESTKSPMPAELSSDFPHARPSAHAPTPTQAPNFRSQMLIESLIAKVRFMRVCQKDYFRTRDGMILRKSIMAEKQVDELLTKLPEPIQVQQQLSIF